MTDTDTTADDTAAPALAELPEVPEREIALADGSTLKVYSHAPLVPIDSVIEHPENPNQGDDVVVEALITRLGFRGEIEVRAETRETVVGNTRLRVMRKLGAAVIPANVRPMSAREARERLLGDNRSRDLAAYDDRQAAALLAQMRAEDEGLLGTGFGESDVDKLLAALDTEVRRPDAVPASERHGNFLGSEIRQIILVMGIPEFERTIALLAVLRQRTGVDSNSEAIVRLLDDWVEREHVEVPVLTPEAVAEQAVAAADPAAAPPPVDAEPAPASA